MELTCTVSEINGDWKTTGWTCGVQILRCHASSLQCFKSLGMARV